MSAAVPSNGTCPSDRSLIPADLPIPTNVTAKIIPGQSASDPWMVACCSPYPVQLVNSCWEWCQVDPAIASNTSDSNIMADFAGCLDVNHRNINVSRSAMVQRARSAATSRTPRVSWYLSLLGGVVAAGFLVNV